MKKLTIDEMKAINAGIPPPLVVCLNICSTDRNACNASGGGPECDEWYADCRNECYANFGLG